MNEWSPPTPEPETYRCPKCGFASTNPEICDACGAVFAKVRERDAAQETYAPSSSYTAYEDLGAGGSIFSAFWFKFLIFLLVIGGAAYLTTQAFVQTTSSPNLNTLITKHRTLITKARRVIAQELEAKESLAEHKNLYNATLDLAVVLQKLPPARGEEEAARREALMEANATLIDLLQMSPQEFEQLLLKKQGADPFLEAEKKLQFAENPSLETKDADDRDGRTRPPQKR